MMSLRLVFVIDSFNGWGVTIIDSLDTMLIMGLSDEFRRGVAFAAKIDFFEKVL